MIPSQTQYVCADCGQPMLNPSGRHVAPWSCIAALRAALAVLQPSAGAVRLTLPFPPSANKYWRNDGGRVLVSRAAKDYKQTVLYTAYQQLGAAKPNNGTVRMWLDFYRARKAGDLDNSLKVLLDSLQGVLYVNDCQIEGLTARRYDDAAQPRVEIACDFG